MSNISTPFEMAPSPSAMEKAMASMTPSSAQEYLEYVRREHDPNKTIDMPVNTNCIMDTECGIRNNGIPAYIKIKRNWEVEAKGLALIREICSEVESESGFTEECARNPQSDAPVRKPDPKANEFVRYEMHVNRHGEGSNEGQECGRAEYVIPEIRDSKGDFIGKFNRSNAAKCKKGDALTKVSVNGHINKDYW